MYNLAIERVPNIMFSSSFTILFADMIFHQIHCLIAIIKSGIFFISIFLTLNRWLPPLELLFIVRLAIIVAVPQPLIRLHRLNSSLLLHRLTAYILSFFFKYRNLLLGFIFENCHVDFTVTTLRHFINLICHFLHHLLLSLIALRSDQIN